MSTKTTRDSKENIPVVAANATINSDNKPVNADRTEKEQETERKVNAIFF